MDSLILLICCLVLGVVFRRSGLLPEKSYLILNSLIIFAALPALILQKIPAIPFSGNVLMPVLMPWLIFGIAIPFFVIVGKFLKWDHQTIGCLIITCGFGNTSFVGIPILQMLWGERGVQIAIMADQPGSFAALSTFGIVVASYFSAGKTSVGELALSVFRFPPFLAFLLALVLNFYQWQFPPIADYTLSRLGDMVVPLALLSVGMQLNPSVSGKDWGKLRLGLGYKLVLAPAIIFTLYILVLKNYGTLSQASVIEAGMGPMITAAIIATNFGLQPELIGRLVGFGIPLSFLSLPVWYWLIQLIVE